METVEVVIRIPKKEFEELQGNYVWWGRHGEYIKKGTVLPKGHGRLIDADAFIEFLKHKEYGMIDYSDCVIDDITECSPTIIEANKESE